jgi:hypothetical protein
MSVAGNVAVMIAIVGAAVLTSCTLIPQLVQ